MADGKANVELYCRIAARSAASADHVGDIHVTVRPSGNLRNGRIFRMYQTDLLRLSKGLIIGLLVGALLIAPIVLAFVLAWDQDQPSWPWQGSLDVVVLTIFWTLILAAGFVVGGLIWLPLHFLSKRYWPVAAVVGFCTSLVVEYLFVVRSLKLDWTVAEGAAIFGLIGAISWSVAWRIAYFKAADELLSK